MHTHTPAHQRAPDAPRRLASVAVPAQRRRPDERQRDAADVDARRHLLHVRAARGDAVQPALAAAAAAVPRELRRRRRAVLGVPALRAAAEAASAAAAVLSVLHRRRASARLLGWAAAGLVRQVEDRGEISPELALISP